MGSGLSVEQIERMALVWLERTFVNFQRKNGEKFTKEITKPAYFVASGIGRLLKQVGHSK